MKLFSRLYEWVYRLAEHPKAVWWLGGISFAESSFFPVPPDAILAPMVLARRNRAWFFALVTTVASVLGGIAGYYIGVYLFDYFGRPLIEFYNAEEQFENLQTLFHENGFLAVTVAALTPLPYKIFTISAGFTGYAFLPFIVASMIGRSARFFLVAGLIKMGGAPFEAWIRKNADPLGWIAVVLIILLVVLWKTLH